MSEFKKFDAAKPKWSLLLGLSGAEKVLRVLEYGAEKYGHDNHLKCTEHSRYVDAAVRHLIAFTRGERLDPESGLEHLAHACAGMILLLTTLEE